MILCQRSGESCGRKLRVQGKTAYIHLLVRLKYSWRGRVRILIGIQLDDIIFPRLLTWYIGCYFPDVGSPFFCSIHTLFLLSVNFRQFFKGWQGAKDHVMIHTVSDPHITGTGK